MTYKDFFAGRKDLHRGQGLCKSKKVSSSNGLRSANISLRAAKKLIKAIFYMSLRAANLFLWAAKI
jgi:hypothetical protein